MSHVTAGKKTETPVNKKDFWNTSDLDGIDRVIPEYLEYDEESPTSLTWKKNVGFKIKAGSHAFTAIGRNGYRTGRIAGRQFYAHRVAWFLNYGKWPSNQIDHINGNRLDNKIINLRDVEQCINSKNINKLSTNTSGFTGVVFCVRDQRFSASYNLYDKKINVPCDGSLFSAVSNLISARRLQGDFTDRHGR